MTDFHKALVADLRICTSEINLYKGHRLHAYILKKGLHQENIVIGNALVTMYAKCGKMARAFSVFHQLSFLDVVSWNVLLSGFCQHGQSDWVLQLYKYMKAEGISPNSVTFLSMINAYADIGAICEGVDIHVEILRRDLINSHHSLGNALVDMYVKFGDLCKAREVLDRLHVRDLVAWTSLISGYEKSGHPEEALMCLERMKSEGFSPDGLAYASILKACGYKGAAQKGKRIHAGIVEEDPLRNGRGVSAALVEMYANGGALAMAQKIFNALPVRDVVSWTVLIGGYYQYGHVHEALKCYDQMKREGLFPDMIAFASILKACGSVGAINKGKQVHADLVRHGFLEGVGVLGCALVDMYAKCGMFGKAHVVLSELSNHDVVPWTALIAGYVQHDRGNDAFDFYQKMQQEGLLPNAVTFACLLKACGSLGTEDKGKEVHAEIARRGLLGKIVELGNSLVDMYAKCGAVAKAQEVFDKLILRNTASWNALITGYSCNGYGNKALNCFKQLKLEGLCPDAVTFICILKACGSMGTAGKGQTYFDKMSSSYGIIPSFMHCSCLVNLFCYWGRFGDAMTLLMKVPFSDHSAVWTTLLSSCRKRGNMKLARLVFDHVM